MRLRDLFRQLPVGPLPVADLDVVGISHDSRRIGAGDLYVAIGGARFDGRRFIPQAAERGAVAVLGAGEAPAEPPIPWIGCSDPRPLMGPLAARIHGHPDRHMVLAGVTGTNGKTTITALLAAILDYAGLPAGRLGTLGYFFGGRSFGGGRTTPEAPDLYRILAEMRAAGAASAVMEVSSHALMMGRVEDARYDVTIFTNLTRDHLDYHGDLESYFAAKRRLFDKLKEGGRSVVHMDDPFGRRLAAELPQALTFGSDAEVSPARVELDLEGIRGTLKTPRGPIEFTSPLLGRYNLENLLAAVAAALALGLEPAVIAAGLAAEPPLPGRLEKIDAGQDFPMLVDYAHTPAALAAALGSLRELSRRDIVLVFGCGGDRDTGKRSLMGRIAGELSALPLATSDNPRSEDPLEILAAVEEGLAASGNSAYRVIPDRRTAIRQAVLAGGPGRAVLVAGKGHEDYQIIGDEERHFSDREELIAALAATRQEATDG